ncbi:MAG: hypothetical protein E7177_00955 [Erysipelotrichaceae bacterium]|nr:hypothetical protein [Erysipelotrichaceae bacterium]
MEKKENLIIPEQSQPVEVENLEVVKTKVNEAREQFLKTHDSVMKKNRIASTIYFGITIGLVILGTFVENLMGLSFGIIIAGLIIIWIYTRHQRKVMDAGTQLYLYSYSLYANSYMYGKEDVKDINFEYKRHIDTELIKKINIVDDINIINSRDIVTGKMYDQPFLASDVSLKVGNPRRLKEQKALFVGKVYTLNYSFVNEGRTLLYLKGCGDATPTKLQDVNQINVPSLKKEWQVYTSHKGYEKIFTSGLIKALNKLECNDVMNDVVISIADGVVIVGFSYSDEAMVIPMRNEYETKHLELKEENYKVFKMINKALIENDNFVK